MDLSKRRKAYEYSLIEKLATAVDPNTTAEPGAFKKMYEYIKTNPGKSVGLTAAGLAGAYGARKLYNRFNEKSASYKYAEENKERTLGDSIARGAGYTGLGTASLVGGGAYYGMNKLHKQLKDVDNIPLPVVKDFVANHRGKAALGAALLAGLGGSVAGGFGGAVGHAGSKLFSSGDREKKASKNDDTLGSRVGSGAVAGGLGLGAAGAGLGHYVGSNIDRWANDAFDHGKKLIREGKGHGKEVKELTEDFNDIKPVLDRVKRYGTLGLGLGGLVAGGLAGGVGGGLVSLRNAIKGEEKKASYDLPTRYLMKVAQEGFVEETKRKLQENAPAILGGGAGALVGGYGMDRLFDKGREANMRTQKERIDALSNAAHNLGNSRNEAELVERAKDVSSSVKRYNRSKTLGSVLGNKYLKGGAIGLGALGGLLVGKESFKRPNDQGMQY